MKLKSLLLFIYGLCLSAITGVLLSLFYLLQATLIEWLWPEVTSRLLPNAVIVAVVGVIIITTRRWWGVLPQNIGRIRADLAHTGTVNYRYVLLQMVVPALILISGTSLGPEATLVSSTVLFAVWIAEKLNYVARHFAEAGQRARWLMVIVPHRYRLPLSPAEWKTCCGPLWRRNALIVTLFANMILWFVVVYQIGGEPSLIIHIGTSNWQWWQLAVGVPLISVSYVLGNLCEHAMVWLRRTMAARIPSETALIITGGVIIYLFGMLVPQVLFSGQHNFHLFTLGWQNQAGLVLLGVAVMKLILLTVSLTAGWLGGDIFPVLFASTNLGFAASYLLPGVDRIFVVTMIVMGMATAILGSPLLVGSLMGVMFVPTNLIGVVIVVTAVLMVWKRRGRVTDLVANMWKLARETAGQDFPDEGADE